MRNTSAFAWATTLALLVVPLFLVATAKAYTIAWQGTLSDPHFMGNGAVLVYTSGSRTGTIPACGVTQPQRFALDSTTPAGKAQLAGILTAFAAGKPVVIVGTGTCSVFFDSETIEYFHIDG